MGRERGGGGRGTERVKSPLQVVCKREEEDLDDSNNDSERFRGAPSLGDSRGPAPELPAAPLTVDSGRTSTRASRTATELRARRCPKSPDDLGEASGDEKEAGSDADRLLS